MFKNVESKIFIPCFLVLVVIIVPMFVIPEQTYAFLSSIFTFCTDKLGWLFMLTVLISFGFLFWISFSRYGNVRLGGPDEKPQYKDISWIAMLFTAGVGTSIVILGFCEPIYYLTDTPFDIVPFSKEAYEYAHMYGQFHWGFSAWALYSPAVVGIAYIMFNKRKDVMRLSSICEPVLKKTKTRFWAYVIDVLVVIGIIGSIVTSLGIGTPVVSQMIMDVFNVPASYSMLVKVIVLIIWMLIFGTSVFLGLDKGIQNLSNINLVLAFVFMAFILIVGPTTQIFKMEVNSIGLYFDQFFRMSTQTDPFGDGSFSAGWTSFYWAWWLAFMPMMGMFVGKISRGRTMRQVMWGQMAWGTAGCCLSFMIFGGYSLYLQSSGQVDLSAIVNSQGNGAAMVAIINTLPLPKFMMIFLCVLLFIYLATTIDSSAYVLGGVTSKHISAKQDPARWNRMFWAVAFCVFSIGLMIIGSMSAVQNITVITGVPLIAVTLLIMYSLKKMLDTDYENHDPALGFWGKPDDLEAGEGEMVVETISGEAYVPVELIDIDELIEEGGPGADHEPSWEGGSDAADEPS